MLATPAGADAGAAEKVRAERLVLALTLDGVAAAEPVLVRREGGRAWMRAADLRALGVAVPGTAAEVALADLPGVTVAIDDAAQTIALTRARAVQRVSAAAGAAPTTGPAAITRSAWGAALNYDAVATSASGTATAGALLDGVVYGPHGLFYAQAVLSTRRTLSQRRFQRLDTGFTLGDPGATRRLTVGDTITGAAEQSRAVRIAGVQLATDFGLRPDLVTFPVPSIAGSAAVPSAVDLIVNGSRRSAGEVRAGQFAVTDLPVQTGLNTVTVATRDALGRETRQTVSTYVSRALLRPGLTAFSVEAGFVRTGYATSADRYADPAASGSFRVGVTDRLTAETHGEVSGHVGVASAGASLAVGRLGVGSAGFGVSVADRLDHRGATQWSVGFERIGRPVSIAAHYQRTGRSWHDLAADHGAVTRDHLLSLTLGFDLGKLGNVGAAVIDQGRGRIPYPVEYAVRRPVGPVLPATRLVNATWSVRLRGSINLVANGGGDLRGRRSGYLSLGALVVLGGRSSAYAGLLKRAGETSGTVDYGRTAVLPGDWGYHAGVTQGGIDRVAADVSYQGSAGFYALAAERTDGAVAVRAQARGAIVLDRAGMLTADRLTGAFAVVDTQGQAGVPVFRDNRRVGVTDRRGRFVVANLPAYQPTKISLDPLLLDDRVVVDRTELWVAPTARAGVRATFALRTSVTAQLQLLLPDGTAVAAGSRASLNGGAGVPVGMDGELYLQDLAPANQLLVHQRGGGTCRARFAVMAGGPIQRLGEVRCVPETLASLSASPAPPAAASAAGPDSDRTRR